jgi:hypothetical protein
MACGHNPREIDNYAVRDLDLFMTALPHIWALQHPLAEVD